MPKVVRIRDYHPPLVFCTKEQLRQLFERCDINGDGKLSMAELRVAFSKLGARFPGFRARQGMARADDNGDGYIELNNEEFERLVNFAFDLHYTWVNT